MSATDMEPAHLRDLLHDCVASNSAQQADRIREVAALLGCGDLRHAIEAMLVCEAYESAAVAILGNRGFLVSRSGTGNCLASVQLEDGGDITAEAAAPALALVAAHLAALLADSVAVRPHRPAQGRTAARPH